MHFKCSRCIDIMRTAHALFSFKAEFTVNIVVKPSQLYNMKVKNVFGLGHTLDFQRFRSLNTMLIAFQRDVSKSKRWKIFQSYHLYWIPLVVWTNWFPLINIYLTNIDKIVVKVQVQIKLNLLIFTLEL